MADDFSNTLIHELMRKVERLDERSQTTVREISELRKDIKTYREETDKEITYLTNQISESYVKKEEFDPVKRFVYGVVGFILISVGGAVFALLK